MQVISEARKDVNKVWGVQSVKDAGYRPLKYLLEEEVEGGLLLHNVISGEMILLDDGEAKWFRNRDAGCGCAEDAPAGSAEARRQLIEKHFLVPTDYDERRTVQQLRKLLRMMNTDRSITGYTILPTTYCNARCFYCYEAGMEHIHMSEETADRTVDFILANRGDHKVSLSWYGGEPLLGHRTISRICEKLAAERIEYSSSMISNGYLFDEELVEIAGKLWKLKNIQITLDGTEETYNRVKEYAVGGGADESRLSCDVSSPYRKVLGNIELLLKAGIRVSVRMNLDYHNFDDLEKLSDELAVKFSGYDNFGAYVHILFDDEGFDPVTHTQEDKEILLARECELNDRLSAGMIYGKDKLGKKPEGKKSGSGGLPALKVNWCMADSDRSAIVYPDGTLAKCEHYPYENLGNVFHGFTELKKCAGWKDCVEYDECDTCRLYPICIKLVRCKCDNECSELHRVREINENVKKMKNAYERFGRNCLFKR